MEKENNIRGLNEWVDYIMEDNNEKDKNSSKKKKNFKTSQNKKKKKTKKSIEPSDFLNSDKSLLEEEDTSIIEFKIKLKNDSINAKEV